jgi:branched-chain amino acid transport system ATP-binding protein
MTSSTATELAIDLQDVTSGYAGIPAIRGLSMTVRRGEVVALLGPNGAGKTTTLLTIAGVLRPTAGTVTVLDRPVESGRPHLAARRGISLVPDSRSLFGGLTAEDNIRLASRWSSKRVDVAEVVHLFPALKPKLRTRAGLLSGGEQQMLAIGRAIAGDAKVLMIDEMSMGLAPVITKSILPIIKAAAVQRGAAVLIVEQHIDLALEVADRGYVLNHGELHLSRTSADLLANRNLVQASYLGTVSPELAADRGRATSRSSLRASKMSLD